MSEDVLAGGEAPTETTTEATEAPAEGTPEAQAGPPDDGGRLADWVPNELRDVSNRAELLKGVGLDPNKYVERPSERPETVPEKFWDPEKGILTDQMAKSYAELEKKLHEKVPQAPDEYDVKAPEGVDFGEEPVLSDEDVTVFKELGLTNDQAQRLTEHFYDTALPLFAQQQAQVEQQKLASDWGIKGDTPEFKQRLGAIKDWAEQNLPKEVQDHLRSSASGVQAMWGMMNARRPPGDTAPPARVSSEKIQEMINDPRYWDDDHPEYRQKVEQMIAQRGG